MTDETLKSLLQTADAKPANPPTFSADALLAAARRRSRATQRRIASAGLATSCLLLAAWTLAPHSAPSIHKTSHRIPASSPRDWSLQRPVPPPTTDQLRAELARLGHEADLAQQVVRAVLEQPASNELTPNELAAKASLPDADLVRLESARSAALVWQYANIVEHELHDPATARLEYQRLVDRFPGTQWADLAATSLRRQ